MSHNVFSIAILNQLIDPSTLESLSHALKKHFAYFEILLLNPTTSPTHKAAARGRLPPPPSNIAQPRVAQSHITQIRIAQAPHSPNQALLNPTR